MAAVKLSPRQLREFTVLLKGAAEQLLLESIKDTHGIFVREKFAMVAGVIALGEQLRGKRILLFLDNNAAAGGLIKASSKIQMILALVESFWECLAQLSAACWVERVASDANPADAPGGNVPSFRTPYVDGELASLQMASRSRQVLGNRVTQAARIC